MNDDTISKLVTIDAAVLEGREWGEGIAYGYAERRGRWIMLQKYNNEYRCSICGEITKRNKTPFCGWCGAKMEVRESDE